MVIYYFSNYFFLVILFCVCCNMFQCFGFDLDNSTTITELPISVNNK